MDFYHKRENVDLYKEIYTELEPEDSLLVILRKRGKNI